MAFPTTPILDQFNYADGTALDLGTASWLNDPLGWGYDPMEVNSNQVTTANDGGSA